MRKRNPLIMIPLFILVLLAIVGLGMLFQWIRSLSIEVTPQGNAQTTHDCTQEIARVMEEYPTTAPDLPQITGVDTIRKTLILNFEGSAKPEVRDAVIKLLEDHSADVTFFLPAQEVGEWPAAELMLRGSDFQSYGYDGSAHMEALTPEGFATTLCRGRAVYQDALPETPEILKLPSSELTEEMLSISKAVGYTSIITGGEYLNYASFQSQTQVRDYVRRLSTGTILNVKLSGVLDALEYKPGETDVTEAVDLKPSTETKPQTQPEKTQEERLIEMVQWLLEAIEEEGFQTTLVRDSAEISVGDVAALAREMAVTDEGKALSRCVYTTDREAGLVLHGIGDEKMLDETLAAIQQLNMKASFVVFGQEVEGREAALQKIQDAGFQILNGGFVGRIPENASYEAAFREIYLGREALRAAGIETNVYFSSRNADGEGARQAAAALNLPLMGTGYYLLRNQNAMDDQTVEACLNNVFGNARPVLCRGDIVYLDLELAENPEMARDLLTALYETRVKPTAYEDDVLQVVTLETLMDHTWDYPAATEETLSWVTPEVDPAREAYAKIPSKFVRGGWQSNVFDGVYPAPGEPQRKAFLTIDDFGDEASIGRLLAVLRKHNTKATFFVITKYADDNRVNLIRAMAEEGHDIGSHSNTHFVANIMDEDTAKAFAQDLWQSNQTLAKIVGDTGHLTRYFRPPTLAITQLGVRTILGCGYSYVIGADVSTGDYNLASPEEVLDRLSNGEVWSDGSRVQPTNGTIFVLHMSANAKYTAEGLDRYLSMNENTQPYKQFSFELFSDWLPEE